MTHATPATQPFASWSPTRGIWETTQLDLYGLSAPFSAIWPTCGWMHDGSAYRLPLSALLTTASASSSSPTARFRTPLATDSSRGGETLDQVRARRGTIALSHQIIDFALNSPAESVAGRSTEAAVVGTFDGSRLTIDTPQGRVEVALQVLGEHNARNALAATAAALASNVSLDAIRRGLEAFGAVKGRLQVKRAASGSFAGAIVIDDTYNANPDSMRAAIDVLAGCAAPRVLVMGDMGEVGDSGPAFHREVGAYAKERGIETLLATGDAARDACSAYGAEARHFDDTAALVAHLQQAGFGPDTTILVKGSRFMKMERVVDAVTSPQPSAPGTTPGAH